MINGVYSSVTGIQASQTLLDVTGNNLANTNTTGFKTQEVTFQDLLYLNEIPPGGVVAPGLFLPTGIQVGTGTALASSASLFTSGPLEETGLPLDLAIVGNGLFQITLADGTTAYTRNGSFRVDADGRLVTEDGDVVFPEITIPPGSTNIAIAADGTITANTPENPNTPTELGQLTLARFVNPQGLVRIGNTNFAEGPNSGAPIVAAPGENGLGSIRQGAVEGSNVDVTTELVNLLIAQRSFAFNAEAIRITNQMLQSTAELL